NIDLLFFGPKAKLRGEFNELYDSLYKNPEPYKAIINMLGRTSGGLSRQELISKLGVNDNGAFSEKLEELEECGFIICSKDYPKNKRDSIYKLYDNYTIFYFKYIKENENIDGFWTSAANSQGVKAWSGLAFERVCLQHVPQIKKALGIAAVASRQHGWHSDSSQLEKGEHGVQIDLIIDRADNIVNLCEMKWASDEYVIDKKYDEELRHKSDVFCRQTKIKKAVHLTMITTFGVKHNIYFDSIQSQVVLDQLFE
ncbi:MAG: ATP-binding protein, partial [Bacteroidales bacterium]|nr:ATP-binding protein [Bacteroidales bacterium]